jgi:hypothetical protein
VEISITVIIWKIGSAFEPFDLIRRRACLSINRDQFLAHLSWCGMTILQSALRLFATLVAMLFLYSPAYAGEGTAIEAFTWQNAPVLPSLTDTQDKKLASLPPTTTIQPLDEPFGVLSTVPVSSGELPERWKTVRRHVGSEASILSSCATSEECPAAARRFLEIIAEARSRDGLARIGVINRAVNLSISSDE